jgi:signal transduction histidine kinase
VLRDEGAKVLLEVHNEGPAIPQDLLPVIFDPFRRGKLGLQDTTTGGAGLGLGMYIVKEIVSRHGGTITVRSTAEDGTTMSVCLPRRADPDEVLKSRVERP